MDIACDIAVLLPEDTDCQRQRNGLEPTPVGVPEYIPSLRTREDVLKDSAMYRSPLNMA